MESEAPDGGDENALEVEITQQNLDRDRIMRMELTLSNIRKNL